MSALMKRMKKNSTISGTNVLSDSKYFKRDSIPTAIPLLNVALSGSFESGITAGLHMLAGDSRTFKTGFLIQLALAFQQKHKDGIVLFIDCEYSSLEFWIASGIDMDRVLHVPVQNIEQCKIELTKLMSDVGDDEHMMVCVDSIGGMPSLKELDDALNEKTVADMSRARSLNSMFRIITPLANERNIPVVLINSFYMTMDMYPKRVYAGGKKVFLSCDDVWFITRQPIKDGKVIIGFQFVINVDKSRIIKEGSKFVIEVPFQEDMDIDTIDININRYSGLYDLAKDFGALVSAGAWIKVMDLATGELSGNVRQAAIGNDYYDALLKHQPFIDFVKNKYVLN